MASLQSITKSQNNLVASLAGQTAYASGSTLNYYFADSTDGFFNIDDPLEYLGVTGDQVDFRWQDEATSAYRFAASVANVDFTEVQSQSSADLTLYMADDLSYPNSSSDSVLLGMHQFPGRILDEDGNKLGIGLGIFNATTSYLTAEAEAGDGNYRAATFLHEIGHGLGLGHPHDTGNGSLSEIEDTELDSQMYTIMSYNSAGSLEYGNAVSYMALDIAALQHIYGSDNTTFRGNTSFTLTDTGSAALDLDGDDGDISIGRAYYSIWDAGGNDSIEYNGSMRAVINLNTATLTRDLQDDALIDLLDSIVSQSGIYSDLSQDVQDRMIDEDYTAGGFFSQIINAKGTATDGGFSIANGAEIEDAEGGSGGDLIIGNQLDNALYGNDGEDELFGGEGDDFLSGGSGNDHLIGGGGQDVLYGGIGDDFLDGDAGDYNQVDYDGSASNYNFTRNTDGTIKVNSDEFGSDTLKNIDGIWFSGSTKWYSIDSLVGDNNNQYVVNGTSGDDYLVGTDSDDIFYGKDGQDVIHAGYGDDIINGDGGDYNQVDLLGNSGDYAFRQNDDGTISANHNTYGTKTLSNIDGVWFIDEGEWHPVDDLITTGTNKSVIEGTNGDDYLTGTNGDDIFNSGGGNDVMTGGYGDDIYNGDGGSYNQVDFLGRKNDYTFSQNKDGSVTAEHQQYGTDILDSIDGAWFVEDNSWVSIDELTG